MMKKLITTIKWQAKDHPLAALLLFVVLAALLWYGAGGFISGARSARTTREVSRSEGQAAQASGSASEAATNANDAGLTRQIEDGVRGRAIKPELERARRRAFDTKRTTRAAQVNYEKAKTAPNRRTLNDDALHGRNCADLRELYPGVQFDGCS